MIVALSAAAACLFGTGTYLLLQRELTRVIIGLALLAHGANLFILLGGGHRGAPTFTGVDDGATFLDPLPQAFILTAIVISFGVTTFLLGLAYRSWVLTQDDEVPDDLEDRRVFRTEGPADLELDEDLARIETAIDSVSRERGTT